MRPLVHFTPEQNFMNDPNGLVFYEGEYHLFYQHNPFGITWGHMSWGHAVSRDLVHWEHLPIALAEENGIMAFSGCAVVDWENTSGLGQNGRPPLVAIFTGHTDHEQTQNIAWSNDRGRTWTKHPANPVIAIGSREHRDPKVVWHAPTRRWIMITVLADLHQVRFDGSPDLAHWQHLSDFGPFGAEDGVWECPDLFPMAFEDQPDRRAWVIKVDVCRTTGAQAIVGDFDGRVFTPLAGAKAWRIDHGVDFYAAQSWSDVPDGRRLWLAWMSNWHYGNVTPATVWRGLCSIPREVGLRDTAEGPRLYQRPARELRVARGAGLKVHQADVDEASAAISALEPTQALEVSLGVDLCGATEFGLTISHGQGDQTRLWIDASACELCLDRTRSGVSDFSEHFPAVHRAPLALMNGRVDLQIFLDGCSIEVFAQDGFVAFTDLIFPRNAVHGVSLWSTGGDPVVTSLEFWPLAPTASMSA